MKRKLWLTLLSLILVSVSFLVPSKQAYASTVSQLTGNPTQLWGSGVHLYGQKFQSGNVLIGQQISSITFKGAREGAGATGNVTYAIINSANTTIWSVQVPTTEFLFTGNTYTASVSPSVYISTDYSITVQYDGTTVPMDFWHTGSDVAANQTMIQQAGSVWSVVADNDMYYSINYGAGSSASVSTLGVNSWEVTSSSAILNGSWVAGVSNASILGFQYGTSTGNYTSNLTASGNYTSIPYNLTASNLTSGIIYYYRAEAYDGSWHYGNEFVFQTSPSLVVTTINAVVQPTQYGLVTNFYGNVSDNADMVGFDIGTSNVSFNPIWGNLYQTRGVETVIGNVTSWLPYNGLFADSTLALTNNTTYYYRAKAGVNNLSVPGTYYMFYGDTKQIYVTTSNITFGKPFVTTNSIFYLDSQVTISGSIGLSSLPIIERGIRFATNAQMTGYGSYSETGVNLPIGIFNHTSGFEQAGGVPFTAGTTIYGQAYASTIGGTSYGAIIPFVVMPTSIGVGGLTLKNTSATVTGNTVVVVATITNPTNVNITNVSFAWGLTGGASDDSDSYPISGTPPTTITYTITGLTNYSNYFWHAGVLPQGAHSWVWSDVTNFTTAQTLPSTIGDIPAIATLAATNIGSNFFTANENLLSVGNVLGSYVSRIGFAYAFDTNVPVTKWATRMQTGNFSVGPYSAQLNVSQTGLTVYIASVAINQYGTAYGSIIPVGTSAIIPTVPGQQNIPGDFSDILRAQMRGLNLDNSTGHWVYMFLWIFFVALIFGLCIVYLVQQNERMLAKMVGMILILIIAVITGTFTWSGLLGWWPIIITIFAAIAGVGLLISIFVNKGSVAE